MQTVVLEEPGRFRVVEQAPPGDPPPGQALVRVHRIGICGTDLHAYRGEQPFFEYPRILGHELGVEVVAVGENDRGIEVGDRCAVEPSFNCGQCSPCRRGKTNCCERLQVLGVHVDGGMRELMWVPVDKLHKSSRLSLDQLALVEMLAIGAHAVRRTQLEPDDHVLVIGAGPIGLSVAQFARASGVDVIMMEINPNRVAFCREHFGIDRFIDSLDDPIGDLRRLLDGDLPTVVMDATGNPRSMTAAFNYVASGGKLVFVGLFQGDITFHDPEFHRREMTLLSSRNATSEDFRRVLEAVENGEVDTTAWITHRAHLRELPDVYPQWLSPESRLLKAVVEVP
ncbi:MAG: zinc-binding alcohol dehydrogenase family protein [Anaerolineae bacterium]